MTRKPHAREQGGATLGRRGTGRRGALSLLAGAALIGSAGPAFAAAKSWNAYTYMTDPEVTAARKFKQIIDEINAQAGGTVDIRLHLGGTLPINAGNISAAVADDDIQFADDTQYLGNVPIGGILRLPFLVSDREEYRRAYKVLEPYIEADYAKKGVTVLAAYTYPLQVIWSREKLTQLADIKGQKIRVTSPEQGKFIERFGGIPITLGTAEVPAALDRGIINGVLTASAGAGYTWRDLLKYNYRLGTNYSDSLIIVNTSAFTALPAAAQATIRTIARQVSATTGVDMQKQEDALTQKMQQAGMVVTPARPEDVAEARQRMAPYWDEWAKAHGPRAVEALSKVRAALKE